MFDKNTPEFRKSLREDEDGAVYVLAIFLVIILLAMAGLAVDAGNIYHARVQLQKATDTGALAGMGSLFINNNVPTDPTAIPSYIEARARELTMENLRAQGFDITNVTIEPSYDTDTRTLTVNTEAEQDFLLMDVVPFQLLGFDQAESSRPIFATAEVRREPANIALVLDMSTSMECPSLGSCNCKTPARDPAVDCAAEAASQSTTQKFEELQTAVATFLTYFDPTFDRISLTLFKKGASVEVSLSEPSARQFDPVEINTALANVSPGSYTNPSAGLIEAYNDMAARGVNGNEEATYVLFSDGAPTAGRFLFSSPKAGLAPENPSGVGDHDYTSFTVHWTNQNTGTSFTGPSMLGKTSLIDWEDSRTDIDVAAAPDCNNAVSDSTSYGRGESIPTQSRHNDVFSECLDSMEVHMPNHPTVSFGNMIDETTTPDYSESFQHLYYHSVVNLTDFLRSRRSQVYTIGLGPEAPDDGSSDPYQDINDSLFRKDVFLTRVSNDTALARPLVGDHHPEFDYDGYMSYDALDQLPVNRTGRYYTASAATELEAVFSNVAQKTLLRLTK